jgi:hypothetical protein
MYIHPYIFPCLQADLRAFVNGPGIISQASSHPLGTDAMHQCAMFRVLKASIRQALARGDVESLGYCLEYQAAQKERVQLNGAQIAWYSLSLLAEHCSSLEAQALECSHAWMMGFFAILLRECVLVSDDPNGIDGAGVEVCPHKVDTLCEGLLQAVSSANSLRMNNLKDLEDILRLLASPSAPANITISSACSSGGLRTRMTEALHCIEEVSQLCFCLERHVTYRQKTH